MVDRDTLLIPRYDGRGANCYGETIVINGREAIVFGFN